MCTSILRTIEVVIIDPGLYPTRPENAPDEPSGIEQKSQQSDHDRNRNGPSGCKAQNQGEGFKSDQRSGPTYVAAASPLSFHHNIDRADRIR